MQEQYKSLYSGETIDSKLGMAHTHSNLQELNKITDGSVSIWNNKQSKLTAGTNITITPEGVISATTQAATWGSITGNINTQADLMTLLDAKWNTPSNSAELLKVTNGKVASWDAKVESSTIAWLNNISSDNRSILSSTRALMYIPTAITLNTDGTIKGYTTEAKYLSGLLSKPILNTETFNLYVNALGGVQRKLSIYPNCGLSLSSEGELKFTGSQVSWDNIAGTPESNEDLVALIEGKIPTNVSSFSNDANYATTSDIPTLETLIENENVRSKLVGNSPEPILYYLTEVTNLGINNSIALSGSVSSGLLLQNIPSTTNPLMSLQGFNSWVTKLGGVQRKLKNSNIFSVDAEGNVTISNVGDGHSHANKSILDEITSSYITNWNDAVTKRHTHNNLTLLNSLTDDFVILAHSHDNMALLDTITEDMLNSISTSATNSHSHSNKEILDSIVQASITSWNEAYTKAHIHNNSGVLASITQAMVNGFHTHTNSDALSNVTNDVINNSHTHTNSSALDSITQTKINLWDNKITNSKDGLSGAINNLNEISLLEDFDGSTALIVANTSEWQKTTISNLISQIKRLGLNDTYRTETQVNTQIDTKINALDSVCAAQSGKAIASITETNGKLTATYIEVGGGGTSDVGNVITVNTTLPTLQANKTYEIKGDVALTSNISIPDNVTFFFNGGSLEGSVTITLNDVLFTGDVKLSPSLQFNGTLKNTEVVLEWFSGLELNPNNTHTQNADIIEKAISITKKSFKVMFNDIYPISRAIQLSKEVHLYGFMQQDVYANRYNQANCGIFTTQFTDGIEVKQGGCLYMTNFEILGWAQLGYSNNNLYNYAQTVTFNSPAYQGEGSVKNFNYSVTVTLDSDGADTCGIRCTDSGTSIGEINGSGVNGFVYGIKMNSNYLIKIANSQIACCRWGLYCEYTSDFLLENIHFNTCHNGYNFKQATLDGSSTKVNIINDAMLMAQATSAVYLVGCGMVQCYSCRFEFNASSIALGYYGHGILINDAIFDSNTGAFISAFAAGKIYNNEEPNLSAITINDSAFMRGCQVGEDGETIPGLAYFNIKHHSGGASTTNKQKLLLNISGDTFSDRCDLPGLNIQNHQSSVFYFKNDTIDDAIKIIFSDNHLEDTASSDFADWNSNSIGRIQIHAGENILPDTINMFDDDDPIKYIENGCLFVDTLPEASKQIKNVLYFVKES